MKGWGARAALLVAFDLIQMNDKDIRGEPIEVHRAMLAARLASGSGGGLLLT